MPEIRGGTACSIIPARRPRKRLLAGGLVALIFALPVGAGAQTYLATEIPHDILGGPVITEDLNGDGGVDAIVPHWDSNLGRELLVYYQQPGGRFAVTPQRIEVKSEILAVGFADLRPAPGKELLLLTNTGAFSLEAGIESYAGNLKPLLEWDLIATMPNMEEVYFLEDVLDLDGDGHSDLLLPDEQGYGLFKGGPGESFQLNYQFATVNQELDPSERPTGDGGLNTSIRINQQEGIVLSLSARRTTPFAGFVEQWNPDSGRSAIMESEHWIPTARIADANGDGRKDILFLNVGNDIRGQMNLLLQREDGTFSPQPDWQGSLDTKGDIRLAHINGDGLVDIVRLRGEGDERSVQLFANRGGSFDLDNPDQIMRFSGYDTRVRFVDIDKDGAPEMNVSYYTIPVVDAIRNASIVRTQLLYSADGAEPGQLFNRRPASRLEESFSAANVRGLAEQMTFAYDIDGDGMRDAVYITDQGALAAKRIGEGLGIAAEPFWNYVPTRSILQFSVTNLNDDGKPDLILRHSTTTSLLVSQP